MIFSPWYWLAIIVLGMIGWFLLRPKNVSQGKRKKIGAQFGEFVIDVTALAIAGKLEPLSGREAEVDRMTHIIMRRSKNNPLLLGQPGVGKTAIVHGLAQRMIDGDVPRALRGKHVLALDLPGLLAGTQHRGDLEKRLKALLDGLEHDPRKYILFIDEIHMLEQANGAEGALDVSDMLKPALSRGELQVVGATTWDEYEKYIKPDPALDRRFQPVLVDEPSNSQAVNMLKSLRTVYEEFHGVQIPDTAITAAVKLSRAKIKGRYLPDKAIDVIDEAAAKVAIETERREHTVHLGVVHEAARNAKKRVTIKDVESVVEQWSLRVK